MKNIIIISVSFILCNCVSNLYADTVYFEGGSEEKGIVVEKYHDRIILNTIDGEKDIQRSEIKDILYDRKEENLVKLGDFHQRKGNQKRAYQYYKKAYELNPEFKEAKDKFIHLRSVILRTPEKQLQDSMSRKQALFKHSGKVYDPSTTKKVPSTQEENFKAATGLILTMDKELPIVESVGNASAAEEAGLVTGDQIVAIWGKMAGYLDLTTMIEMIMENPSAEIIFTIKRKITIAGMEKSYDSIDTLGLSLDIQEQGIVISGLNENSKAIDYSFSAGDIISDINGESTRYMPFNIAKSKIDKSLYDGRSELTIIRDVALWRKEL